MAPDFTGLTPILAADDGSSGLMIAEYLAGDALARLRTDATPAVLGSVSISCGLRSTPASLGSRRATHAARSALLRTVLGLEWLAAERALRDARDAGTGVLAEARALASEFNHGSTTPARRGRALPKRRSRRSPSSCVPSV